jgi:iron-sulfur cluster assembly protein
MIHLSPAAIHEISRLKQQRLTAKLNARWVRLSVSPGGCADFYYSLEFGDRVLGEEHLYNCEGVEVVIDPHSLQYLQGTTIDYSEDLMGGGFRFHNPNATQSCDCGNSFAIAQPTKILSQP